MANLKNRETGEVASQYTVEQRIRAIASCPPTINFAEFGWDVVFPVPKPKFDVIMQQVQYAGEELTPLGTLQEVWKIVDLDDKTIENNKVEALKQAKAQIEAEIVSLELTITERMKREVLLGLTTINVKTGKTAKQHIADTEVAIELLRGKLK